MGKISANYQTEKEDDYEIDADDRPAFESENDGAEIYNEGDSVEIEGEEPEDAAPAKEVAVEDKPKYTFKTDEDLERFLATKSKPEPKAEEKPEPEEDIDSLTFWKGQIDPDTGKWVGEAPKDWNDFARTILKQVAPGKFAPKVLSEIRNMTKKEQAEMESINAEFDAEYDELAASGSVPKRGTKEGDAVNAQISTIGGTYGLTSIKKAHELWAKIPKEQGGGLNYKPVVKVNPSKMVSRLVGSSQKTQAASKSPVKMSYNRLHSARSIDDLLDD